MHSNLYTIKHLHSSATSLCLGGGRFGVNNKLGKNILSINEDINVIDKDCFNKSYIGPETTIIFEGYIHLEAESITSGQFKKLVFKHDAVINKDAFFSKECNSNLYKNYTLYASKGSNVERFAKAYKFNFKEINEYSDEKSDIGDFVSITNEPFLHLIVQNNDSKLFIGNSRAHFTRKAKRKNGDYTLYESICCLNQFNEAIETFFAYIRNNKLDKECDYYEFNSKDHSKDIQVIIDEAKLYLFLDKLKECFKNFEISNYFDSFKTI